MTLIIIIMESFAHFLFQVRSKSGSPQLPSRLHNIADGIRSTLLVGPFKSRSQEDLIGGRRRGGGRGGGVRAGDSFSGSECSGTGEGTAPGGSSSSISGAVVGGGGDRPDYPADARNVRRFFFTVLLFFTICTSLLI